MPVSSRGISIIRFGLAHQFASQSKQIVTEEVTGFDEHPRRRKALCARYRKPLIILIDEFSISAADIFPAMMQDNARRKLVGMCANGGRGSVSGWPTGYYSESNTNNTNTLVVRRCPIATTELPIESYVENIGARPDIELDYMTRNNMLNAGRPFVAAFTAIIADEIRKSR